FVCRAVYGKERKKESGVTAPHSKVARSPEPVFPDPRRFFMHAAVRSTLALAILVLFLGTLLADDWPGFRGNKGGVADDKDLPVKWTKENILWKVKLPGPGTSSPITSGDKVFVTAYAGYGTTLTKGMGGGFGGKGGFGKGGFGKGKGGPDSGGDQK